MCAFLLASGLRQLSVSTLQTTSRYGASGANGLQIDQTSCLSNTWKFDNIHAMNWTNSCSSAGLCQNDSAAFPHLFKCIMKIITNAIQSFVVCEPGKHRWDDG